MLPFCVNTVMVNTSCLIFLWRKYFSYRSVSFSSTYPFPLIHWAYCLLTLDSRVDELTRIHLLMTDLRTKVAHSTQLSQSILLLSYLTTPYFIFTNRLTNSGELDCTLSIYLGSRAVRAETQIWNGTLVSRLVFCTKE